MTDAERLALAKRMYKDRTDAAESHLMKAVIAARKAGMSREEFRASAWIFWDAWERNQQKEATQ